MTAASLLAETSHPGNDPAVVHFVIVAKEFCRLLESEAVISQRDLIHQLLTAILALFAAGLALPEVDPEPSAEEPFFDVHSRKLLRAQFVKRLGGEFADRKSPHGSHPRLPMTLRAYI
jgi:hypothetical protein